MIRLCIRENRKVSQPKNYQLSKSSKMLFTKIWKMRLMRSAMMAHPELVAGEGRACTNLMRAMGGKVAIKTGAEAFFVAIIPEKKMGVALKITDGTTRASECAIAAILVKLGVLDAEHPETQKYLNAPIRNWRGTRTGTLRAAPALI